METASETTTASDSKDTDVSGPTEGSDEDRLIKMEVSKVFWNKQKKYCKVKRESRKVKDFPECLVV